MIKLSKQTCPQILTDKRDDWTNEVLAEIRLDGKIKSSKYTHPAIKSAIIADCYGKCMYCEAKIIANNYGDIEHLKPKATYPKEMFEWNNLGFACTICNNNKSNRFDENNPFINPFVDDPADSLFAFGTYIKHHLGNTKGELTEKVIDLNRPELLEKRKHRVDSIFDLLDRYANEQIPSLKEILEDEILNQIGNDKEFLMCVRALVKAQVGIT